MQALNRRYEHLLSDLLVRLAVLIHDADADEKVTLTAAAITAERELASAVWSLIAHVPAITAALRDAADYRADADDVCAACRYAPAGKQRDHHTDEQATATAYEIVLHAITG